MNPLAILEVPVEQVYFRCEVLEEDNELTIKFMKKHDLVTVTGYAEIQRLLEFVNKALESYEDCDRSFPDNYNTEVQSEQ